MNNKQKILLLHSIAMDIQMQGEGACGFPYVDFETSNYGWQVCVRICPDGFDSARKSEAYDFDISDANGFEFDKCKQRLLELKALVSEGK